MNVWISEYIYEYTWRYKYALGTNWIYKLLSTIVEAAQEAANALAKEAQEVEDNNQPEDEYADLVFEDRPIVSRDWTSDTMDVTQEEVHLLNIHSQRPEMTMTISRPHHELGQAYKFGDRDAELSFVEFRQHKVRTFMLLLLLWIHFNMGYPTFEFIWFNIWTMFQSGYDILNIHWQT